MRLKLVNWGLLSTVLLCAGCTSHKEAKTAETTSDWRFALSTTPPVPRQLDPTQFQVKMTDSSGRPVTGATVVVQLAMPAMDMGQNQVTAQAAAAGGYSATDRFTMPGDWQVTVKADKGAAHQTQTFPITVR